MLYTKIPMPDDKVEIDLTINTKKSKLKKDNFNLLTNTLKIPLKTVQNIYAKFLRQLNDLMVSVDISFWLIL